MKTNQLRQLFLDYFSSLQHTCVPSSTLIPNNDSTLLFTNAGMVQFKDVFLGKEQRAYQRAVSIQRCVRAGGKHNDLENVGYTARHHTFFEMLGNFSFGDYFKREAIQYAWDFLTQILKLPSEKLWVTVFKEDYEAARIWLEEIKIDPKRLSRLDERDNFWSMGDTGPCGPCSEIFYDHGPALEGGPPGSLNAQGDRYVEVWNLVFMQFDRDAKGKLVPLPRPSVDTGMGLERIAAVMQGVHNNYDTDLFRDLIQEIIQLSGCQHATDDSIKVIADHIRSVSFLIADGVLPSNEGRGYVLRRIMRRAMRHGNRLGFAGPFFYKLLSPLIKTMGEAYPVLCQNKAFIESTILGEEKLFAQTLEQGLKILEQTIAKIENNSISGETVFLLYDTYGFPPDLTADIARERNLNVDQEGFEKAMRKQRALSQETSKFGVVRALEMDVAAVDREPTVFTGYENLCEKSKIVGLFKNGKLVQVLHAGEAGIVLLDRTPFYAQAGGQVGDQGTIDGFFVTDTQKQGDFYWHQGVVKEGALVTDSFVRAEVNTERRQAIQLNHSATHLLHAALRALLGPQVVQKGSLVREDYLRFDFSYPQPLTQGQTKALEEKVNQQIRLNQVVQTQIMTLEQAKKNGVMALFSEKYADQVRVLTMGEFSAELCGGTHVNRTGEIGLFKIISEVGIAAGVRRIEAVTGHYALAWLQKLEMQLYTATHLLKTDQANFMDKLNQILERYRQLEKETEKLQRACVNSQLENLSVQSKNIQGINVLALNLEEIDPKALRSSLDFLKQKLKASVLVLAGIHKKNIILVCSVSQDCLQKIKARDLLIYVAEQVGGKAGGRADMAQGGGHDIAALPGALGSVYKWVENKLCP